MTDTPVTLKDFDAAALRVLGEGYMFLATKHAVGRDGIVLRYDMYESSGRRWQVARARSHTLSGFATLEDAEVYAQGWRRILMPPELRCAHIHAISVLFAEAVAAMADRGACLKAIEAEVREHLQELEAAC